MPEPRRARSVQTILLRAVEATNIASLPVLKSFDVLTSSPLIAYQPEAIWHARRAFFDEGRETVGQIGDAVLRSWRRCSDQGHRVQDAVEFAPVERSALQLLMERNRTLLEVAQPELGSLARSVSDAGYATLLTDARGHALAVDGAISSHSKPLRHAFRAGVDLSEASIGTNAMSVAMSEEQPVSVCGPEHYFSDVQVFHCCAAPVFDPQGQPIGHIRLPERCANLCFGGADNNRLFMASSHSLYAVYVNTRGAEIR